MNSISIVGNLAREPELKFVNSGQAVASLTIGHTRKGFNDKPDTVSFFDIVAWGSLAENVANSLKKGDRVFVTGRLEQRSWEGEDGKKVYKIEIIAEAIGPDLRFAGGENKTVKVAKPVTEEYAF